MKILAAAACGLLTLAAAAAVTLVENGANPLPVFHPAKPHTLERTAARQLAGYLEKMSGVAFTVQPVPEPLPERGIFVGAIEPKWCEGLRDDDFRMTAEGQRLILVGGSPRGTMYAVFALLEEKLGCRWWARDAETVPTGRTTLALEPLDQTVRCDFTLHDLFNKEAQSGENAFVYKVRTKSTETIAGGHTLYPLLTPYAREHAEIYPMDKKGERKANNLHFCYLAPGIAEALAKALAVEVERRRGNVRDVIYFAGMGDWYGGMCQCPECKKVYEEETWTDPDGRKKPGYTATLLRMINRTADILDEPYPGIRVGTFAYMSLEAPPAATRPASNVVLRVPRLRHCTVHAVGECGKNASFLRNLERWTELAPGRVYVWDYSVNFGHNFMFPFPCLRSMAGNIAHYRRLGVQGLEIQGNYVSTGGDLAVLKNYVWRRLLWEPSLTVDAALKEFAEGYYGPAAAAVLGYVETLEQSVREPNLRCADEFAGFAYLTPEVLQKMRDYEAAALAAVGEQEPLRQRVREATAGLEALALWKTGPLVEEGDRLIRRDLGGYTYDRAQALLTVIRGASPREWGQGRAYHMGFLPLHGGPLARLRRGPLEVTVSPAIEGRIRQIVYDGTPLLHVEEDARAKGYPQLGGSVINVGVQGMALEGAPDGHELVMKGEAGISNWSPDTKQYLWQRITLPETGGIAIRASGRRAARGPAERAASIVTSYAVGNDPAAVRVEYASPDAPPDEWQAVALDQGEVALETFAAWRVVYLTHELEVIDRIVAPQALKATLRYDATKGILTTTVTMAAVTLPPAGAPEPEMFLHREILVQKQ
jgi:hypothetical protein